MGVFENTNSHPGRVTFSHPITQCNSTVIKMSVFRVGGVGGVSAWVIPHAVGVRSVCGRCAVWVRLHGGCMAVGVRVF